MVVLTTVGNKCDLDKREITSEEGKKLAARYEGMYLETSAKTATGIEAVFSAIARYTFSTSPI
jgi:GTPase SAR1 family protein